MSTSELWARVATIGELAQKWPGLGRTALMKLSYFLQAVKGVPLGYDFTLYAYGPYDPQVLEDLDYARVLGVVDVKLDTYANGYGYRIRAAGGAQKAKEKASDFVSRHQSALDWVISEFMGHRAADLELLSTIVYTDREAQRAREPLSLKELARRVSEVKPHFSREQIEAEAMSLRRKGLLRAAP